MLWHSDLSPCRHNGSMRLDIQTWLHMNLYGGEDKAELLSQTSIWQTLWSQAMVKGCSIMTGYGGWLKLSSSAAWTCLHGGKFKIKENDYPGIKYPQSAKRKSQPAEIRWCKIKAQNNNNLILFSCWFHWIYIQTSYNDRFGVSK